MTMKRLRKLSASLPTTVIRAGAHTMIALGAGTMCALGGTKPETWWLPIGLGMTVTAIQWAWLSGRDAGLADAYRHTIMTAAEGGVVNFSITPSREQQEWSAAAKAATAALREITGRDHFGDVNKMVPDHVPDAGKMEDANG